MLAVVNSYFCHEGAAQVGERQRKVTNSTFHVCSKL